MVSRRLSYSSSSTWPYLKLIAYLRNSHVAYVCSFACLFEGEWNTQIAVSSYIFRLRNEQC